MITFKVWIPGQGRRVWKNIHVPESETLDVLATAIIDAFGLDGDPTHLYKFYFSEKPWERDQVEFVHPAADGMKADKIKLSHLKFRLVPGETFNFLYDFGEEWRLKVKVESVRVWCPKCQEEVQIIPRSQDGRYDDGRKWARHVWECKKCGKILTERFSEEPSA